MASIAINGTGHALFACGLRLIPGTNVLPEGFDASRLAALAATGRITLKDSDTMTDGEKAEAVAKANTEAELEKVEAALGVDGEARSDEIAAVSGRPKRKRKG